MITRTDPETGCGYVLLLNVLDKDNEFIRRSPAAPDDLRAFGWVPAGELEHNERSRDLASAQLLIVGSTLANDPKLDPYDESDPRWTPTLRQARQVMVKLWNAEARNSRLSDDLTAARARIAELEGEQDEWQRRAETACAIVCDDRRSLALELGCSENATVPQMRARAMQLTEQARDAEYAVASLEHIHGTLTDAGHTPYRNETALVQLVVEERDALRARLSALESDGAGEVESLRREVEGLRAALKWMTDDRDAYAGRNPDREPPEDDHVSWPAGLCPELYTELGRMRVNGFRMQRCDMVSRVSNGTHAVQLTQYRGHDGSFTYYVEAIETHDGHRGARVMALSEAVHLLRNVGDDEAFQIGARETTAATARAEKAEGEVSAARSKLASVVDDDEERSLLELVDAVELEINCEYERAEKAEAELKRYSMCAGLADQYRAEARAVRRALGFGADSGDVAPVDLTDALAAEFAHAAKLQARAEATDRKLARVREVQVLAKQHADHAQFRVQDRTLHPGTRATAAMYAKEFGTVAERLDAALADEPESPADIIEDTLGPACSPEESKRRIEWAQRERAEMMRPKTTAAEAAESIDPAGGAEGGASSATDIASSAADARWPQHEAEAQQTEPQSKGTRPEPSASNPQPAGSVPLCECCGEREATSEWTWGAPSDLLGAKLCWHCDAQSEDWSGDANRIRANRTRRAQQQPAGDEVAEALEAARRHGRSADKNDDLAEGMHDVTLAIARLADAIAALDKRTGVAG